ncbi:MAG: response regulator [Magnetococcales bacterium]|nr:response regulator [Magnetococcales bacterium]
MADTDSGIHPATPTPIRVFILESAPLALTMIRRDLESQSDITVVGSAKSTQDGINQLDDLNVQVICANLNHPVLELHHFIRKILQKSALPILLYSVNSKDQEECNLFHLLEAGAADLFPTPLSDLFQGDLDERQRLAKRVRILARINHAALPKESDLQHRPTPLPDKPAPALNMVIVGATLGGPQAIKEVLAPLSTTFPAPILCIVHLPAQLMPELAGWLSQHVRMPIHILEDNTVPAPGAIYLPPADNHIYLDNRGRVRLDESPPINNRRPSISRIMESAARHLGETVAGVLLSGAGTDGLRGLQAIYQAGGVTLVQSRDSALSFDLPRQAMQLGAARYILSGADIGKALITLSGLSESTPSPELETNGPHLLIVEDSPTQAFKLKKTLQQNGYRITTAKDGQEGLEKTHQEHPELIVSDVSMPRMDGFELCQAIKSDPAIKHIPVILLTALTNPGEILKGLDAGADNYLTKPWQEADILLHIAEILKQSNSADSAESANAPGLEVSFGDQTYVITSTRRQILNLLLATYQRTLNQNQTLSDQQLDLKMLNMKLVEQVQNRDQLNQRLETEIQERVRIEAGQEKLLSELEQANSELDDFAHIISHDLKAPFRSIGSLANWIVSDYGQQLDADGTEMVELLARRATRINDLIDALLQYTKVSRINDTLTDVNLNRLIKRIIKQIEPSDQIDIQIPIPLPNIHFDERRAEQIFHHLLDNAIRFMEQPTGHVTINWQQRDHWYQFQISDTGPGIDSRYFEKIFQVFQTLQPRDDLETIGMGLAITRKIIMQYQGKIQVNSTLGQGSTFTFTLPLKPDPLPKRFEQQQEQSA